MKFKSCLNCEKEFARGKCRSDLQWEKQRYCSKECSFRHFNPIRQNKLWANMEYREMMSRSHLGKNIGEENPNWKGGKDVCVKRSYKLNRQKVLARHAVFRGMKRGEIRKRNICEICYFNSTECHHPDYSKPLDFIELCIKCHKYLHNQMKHEVRNT